MRKEPGEIPGVGASVKTPQLRVTTVCVHCTCLPSLPSLPSLPVHVRYSHGEVGDEGVARHPVSEDGVRVLRAAVHHGHEHVRRREAVEHVGAHVVLSHFRRGGGGGRGRLQ